MILSQVNQAEKPPEVDLAAVSSAKLQESLENAREIVLTELLKSVKAIERAENGAVNQSDELRAQHDRTVKLTCEALVAIESGDYKSFVVNSVEERERSAIRKKKTTWEIRAKVPQTDFSALLKDEKIVRLLRLREFAHTAYEEAFIQMEAADNGTTEITPAESYVLTTQQNLTGLIIPCTDSAEFLWEWRQALIETHRDPERMGDDGDDFF